MGIRLKYKGNPIGVLKVEFPNTFDSDQHYRSEDKEYFYKCATKLESELSKFYEFILLDDTRWDIIHTSEFLKYIFEIIRTQLFTPEENLEFWKRVKKYIDKNHKEIEKVGPELISEIPFPSEKAVKKITVKIPKQYKPYLTEFIISLAIQYIIRFISSLF